MYWLMNQTDQDRIRDQITKLAIELNYSVSRDQSEQFFPFNGRKHREVARSIIEILTSEGDTICDPFSGSGIFSFAGLDANRRVILNEWEPYAFKLSTMPFREIIDRSLINIGVTEIISSIGDKMNHLYKTLCPECGKEHVLDGLFYDRIPENYFTPSWHERMGKNGENVIFRGKKYKCECGCKEKNFDASDEAHLREIEKIAIDFPNYRFVENSRINFTNPEYITYDRIFPHRSQIALIYLQTAIGEVSNPDVKEFLYDVFLSMLHLGKYNDYRSKSQDPHCPPIKLKETNLYHRYLERVESIYEFVSNNRYHDYPVNIFSMDFREFFSTIEEASVDLILTDPPYGDTVQYFEMAQRFHPFMGYSLRTDFDRLKKEVVVSNSPERPDKKNREQFLEDIEKIFENSNRVLKEHGYMVFYFRPEQNHWITDLNKLKVMARKHGFEPLITLDLSQNDPSMRVLASTTWSFKKDICFVFLKLTKEECRWFEDDIDIDELVYVAAREAAGDRGEYFTKQFFNREFTKILRKHNLSKLVSIEYENKINDTMLRFCDKDNARYQLTGESPYERLHYGINPEIRVREFVPIVVEELSSQNEKFTFEQFIIRLSTYLDNGNRSIIDQLYRVNKLIPELLLTYCEESDEGDGFVVKETESTYDTTGEVNLLVMDPSDFENLVADYFRKRGFIDVSVVGRSRDRGVDIIATSIEGEIHLIQCKRYRTGNNIGSNPIQRVDSFRRTRSADVAWVVTTSDFTVEGKDEARISGVNIVNGKQLIESLNLYYPNKYYI